MFQQIYIVTFSLALLIAALSPHELYLLAPAFPFIFLATCNETYPSIEPASSTTVLISLLLTSTLPSLSTSTPAPLVPTEIDDSGGSTNVEVPHEWTLELRQRINPMGDEAESQSSLELPGDMSEGQNEGELRQEDRHYLKQDCPTEPPECSADECGGHVRFLSSPSEECV